MCPDWESNQQPFGLQAGAQPTEPHQPGLPSSFCKELAHTSQLIPDPPTLTLRSETWVCLFSGPSCPHLRNLCWDICHSAGVQDRVLSPTQLHGTLGWLGGRGAWLGHLGDRRAGSRGRERESLGSQLVLMLPWGSPPLASPQYNELPHYPGIADTTAALAGFSEAAPPAPRAPGPYGPHRPPQPPPPGLDGDSLKREKDEIYG